MFWPDIAHSVATPSKSSSAPSQCHHQLSEGLAKHPQGTRLWEIKCRRPVGKFSNDLPRSNCQTPAPPPDTVGEFHVNTSQPKLTGFVDASCGSELRKQGSIEGCVCTFSGGTFAHKVKTLAAAISGSKEAKFLAAFTAAKAAQHLRSILQELGLPQDGPREDHADNQAAPQMTNDNQAPNKRSRHLDTRFFRCHKTISTNQKDKRKNQNHGWAPGRDFLLQCA